MVWEDISENTLVEEIEDEDDVIRDDMEIERNNENQNFRGVS